jgi:hypothetical protein
MRIGWPDKSFSRVLRTNIDWNWIFSIFNVNWFWYVWRDLAAFKERKQASDL